MLRLLSNSGTDTATHGSLHGGAAMPIQRQPAQPGGKTANGPGEPTQGSAGKKASSSITVDIPSHITATSTPPEMKVDRIPPGIETWVEVSLSGTPDPAAPVTFTVEGQGSGNGSVTIDGASARDISSPGKATLKLQGVDQTDDKKHAGHLHLTAQQGSSKLASSAGFSVSSIPQDMEVELIRSFKGDCPKVEGKCRGIEVLYNWQADSQNKSLLDKAPTSERVEHHAKGVLAGGVYQSSCYKGSTKRYADQHLVGPIESLTKAGHDTVSQTFMFKDERTGAENIPMRKSGFLIEHIVQQKEKSKTFEVITGKKGADATAKDSNPKCKSGAIASKAGGGVVEPVSQDI